MTAPDRLASDPPLAPEETRRRASEYACPVCDHQGWIIALQWQRLGGVPGIDTCPCMDDYEDDVRLYLDDVRALPEAQAALAAAVRRQILAEGPEREDHEER